MRTTCVGKCEVPVLRSLGIDARMHATQPWIENKLLPHLEPTSTKQAPTSTKQAATSPRTKERTALDDLSIDSSPFPAALKLHAPTGKI